MEGSDCKEKQAGEGTGLSDDEFFHRLQQFPNFLLHDFVGTISISRLQAMLTAYELGQSRGREDYDEAEGGGQGHGETHNFNVFLHWMLGHKEQAEETARQEQRAQPTDLVACTNLAFILRRIGDVEGAERQLRQLLELRDRDPAYFATLEVESQHELLYLYRRCIFQVRPYAFMDRMKDMLSKTPGDASIKIGIALNLHRCTNVNYMSLYPDADFTTALRTAIELYAEVKDDVQNKTSDRAVAAAELGGIFSWKGDKSFSKVVVSEMKRLGLDAAHCFEEALRLSPKSPSVLVRAGRFYCFSNLGKSKTLLEKALFLRPEAKAHHYLGLTLKRMAGVEKRKALRRGGPTSAGYAGRNRNPAFQNKTQDICFSREDMYIEETIHHFKAALDLCYGENIMALNALGQLHRELGEFEEALSYLMSVVDRFTDPSQMTVALEEILHVYSAKILEENDQMRKKPWESKTDSLKKMVIDNECQILLRRQGTSAVPLQSVLAQTASADTDTLKLRWNVVNDESRLFACIRRITSHQLFTEMRSYTKPQISDATFLEGKVQELLTARRHDDAVLLLNLLTVTDLRPVTSTWQDADLCAKSCVLAALDRLQMCPVTHDRFEGSLAKLFFRQAFRHLFLPSISYRCGHGDTGKKGCPVQTDGKNQSESEPSVADELLDLQDKSASQTGTDQDDQRGSNWQIQVLCDPEDTEAKVQSSAITCVLRDVCGLTVMEEALYSASKTMNQAQVLVFVVAKKDISPKYEELMVNATEDNSATQAQGPIQSAASRLSSRDQVVAVLLHDSPLPVSLQGHRAFPCHPELLHLAREAPRSAKGAAAVRQLFCSVFGLTM